MISALEDGGNETLEELLDHPLTHLLLDALEE